MVTAAEAVVELSQLVDDVVVIGAAASVLLLLQSELVLSGAASTEELELLHSVLVLAGAASIEDDEELVLVAPHGVDDELLVLEVVQEEDELLLVEDVHADDELLLVLVEHGVVELELAVVDDMTDVELELPPIGPAVAPSVELVLETGPSELVTGETELMLLIVAVISVAELGMPTVADGEVELVWMPFRSPKHSHALDTLTGVNGVRRGGRMPPEAR